MRRAPDEFVGLPAGVLASGAAAAVGTLWSVADDTAAAFTTAFLAAHLHPDGTSASLRRGVSRHPAPPAPRDLTRHRRRQPTGNRKPTAPEARDAASLADNPPKHPFQHPNDWAGFTYTGA